MITEDVQEKLKNNKFLVESEKLGFTDLPKLTNTIKVGMATAAKTGDFQPLVDAMGDVYEVLSQRVQIGAEAEKEMGVMSEIVSKDMDRLMKFSTFMTKVLLDLRKQVENEKHMKFNRELNVAKFKRGDMGIKNAENVQILNIMGSMDEEEKKRIKTLLNDKK